MNRLNSIAIGLAVGASMSIFSAAHAAPVTWTHDYGTGPGQVAPIYGVGGTMAANHVTVLDREDSGGNRFYDEIDFSGFQSVDSLTLTLHTSGASNLFENWHVYGTINGGTKSDTDRVQLGNRLTRASSWSVMLTSGLAFEQAVSTGTFAFWFGENGLGSHDFNLISASLTVDGVEVAPIPLPAAGLLLIGAFGGFALLRRRQSDGPSA